MTRMTIQQQIDADLDFATRADQMAMEGPDVTYGAVMADILVQWELEHPRAARAGQRRYNVTDAEMEDARHRVSRPPYRPSYARR